jgi:restriction system protein
MSYLARAGAIERPARGRYRITEAGRQLLEHHLGSVRERDREELPDDGTFQKISRADDAAPDATTPAPLDPVGQIDDGITRMHADIAAELLERLHTTRNLFSSSRRSWTCSWRWDSAVWMAKPRAPSSPATAASTESSTRTPWASGASTSKRSAIAPPPLGCPKIQEFVGALAGRQASQGVFITTASFSSAVDYYAHAVPARVVLVDGARLTDLMIHDKVGVQVKRTVEIVEVDEDFFE